MIAPGGNGSGDRLRPFDVVQCASQDPALLELLRRADLEFVTRYPELRGQRRGPLLPDIRFLVAQSGAVAAGCCALQAGGSTLVRRPYELKRLFVIPEARGTGVIDALLNAAEGLAVELGAELLCLETGERQPAAMRVALRHGYAPIPPYPPYLDDPFARCFAKRITQT